MDPLNQQNPQSAPIVPPAPAPAPVPLPPTAPQAPRASYPTAIAGNGQKKVGPIIAILVIVLILIVAALYLFASRISQQSAPVDQTSASRETTNPNADQQSSANQSVQPVTNNSDDVNSIQADLNVSTNGLDSQNF